VDVACSDDIFFPGENSHIFSYIIFYVPQ